MARARNIKPGFFENEFLAELPALDRLLFIGLWTIADRTGRLEDRPKRIKAAIMPYDDFDADASLERLADSSEKFIIRYEVEGVRYIQIRNFSKHQNPHTEEKARNIPPPCENHATRKVKIQAPDMYGASTVQELDKHSTSLADSLLPITDSLLPIKPLCPPAADGGGEPKEPSQAEKTKAELRAIRNSFAFQGELSNAVNAWIKYKIERREGYKPEGLRKMLTQIKNSAEKYGDDVMQVAILNSMASNYKGIVWPTGAPTRASPNPSRFSNFTQRKNDHAHLEQLQREKILRELQEDDP